ncbi:prevent-host-death family protein [Rhodococcus sp. LBL1]|nr:prevent-host-death family protein [Rhodococcus sp. LBL1]MDH6683389.1 prevent-host-death family protein [Rhodococcus sp. LBL2]
MMTTVPFGEARAQLRELLCRAEYGRERITITRHGAPAAALVSVEDLRALEALEVSEGVHGGSQPAVLSESVVIGAAVAAVWSVLTVSRWRSGWWSSLLLDAYCGGEVLVDWDERAGCVIECTDGESITIQFGGEAQFGPLVLHIELVPRPPVGESVEVRIRQDGPGPDADYWRERLDAWKRYAEALSSSPSIQP